VVDAFAFDPCGYSCNGLLGNHYFTIHATPQSGSSYASFETNYPFGNYTEIVNQVKERLFIFVPG
jgi:S-adenosylmethionine decarboxylase